MRLTRARGTRRGPAHPRGGLALALNNNKKPVQGKGKENALGTRTPAPPSSPDEERRLFVAHSLLEDVTGLDLMKLQI